MGVLHVLITYINFVNILKCQVLVALAHVDIRETFSRNAMEILFHQLVAPTILVHVRTLSSFLLKQSFTLVGKLS